WEREAYESATESSYSFPNPDLLLRLVDLYFEHSNILFPILHRPTFEQRIRNDDHTNDGVFGAVVLLVCAIGSRFSSDPCVILEGTNSWHSAGWAWFLQVRLAGISIFSGSSLCDLQCTCLGAIYLLGVSAFNSAWNMIGMGIRLAQGSGANRKRSYGSTLTVDDELYRRSFWVLVCLDRDLSLMTGRPCSIQEEDFDVDMPVDCDDEHWLHSDPEKAFKQPPGRPSRISAFLCKLQLCQIDGYALRTIHASQKAKYHFGFTGQDWEHRTVTSFDSILNVWVDSIPEHLRWDPAREDDALFFQSAHLYAKFYELQVLIHQPFIWPRKTSQHSFPSLAICVNAARSCTHILDELHRRYPGRIIPFLHRPVLISALVLLIRIWNVKQSKLPIDIESDLSDVKKCMRYMETLEGRWFFAGRARDIIGVLALRADVPVSDSEPFVNRKRKQ
ncbi:fungal-specific transcription factor domain-containing protein, partial [Vararia minispora EC-137]